MSLASRLPYDHPYAGGYPGIGSQPLPTDADALDYLARVKTADGAGVETGVATAVDAFFRDTKAAGVFDALKACCILAGARTLAGALVPVVGDAPANVADGFVEGDYSRTSGLTGDGATTYLDSGRANNADPQNDKSLAAYISVLSTSAAAVRWSIGDSGNTVLGQDTSDKHYGRINDSEFSGPGSATPELGFVGVNRSDSANKNMRFGGVDYSIAANSVTPSSVNLFVFRRNEPNIPGYSDATLAFYSIGTSLSLEDLDTAVTNLIARLKFALLVGENPSGLDPDTINYIVSGYENGSTLQ